MSIANKAKVSEIPWAAEWSGKMPRHWEKLPCRAVVENVAEKNEGATNQNYLSLMANVGVIPYEDKGNIGNKKPDDLTKCKFVKRGNLVINSMNYSIGSYGMSDYDGICSPVYIILKVREEVALPRFVLRVFENKAFQKYVASLGNGILSHRAAISWDDIKGIHILLPKKEEQHSILQFLDREIGKIDRLTDMRRQQMAFLKEQRAALIQQAVTRGLNPKASMKDTGLPWLGEIPVHWDVMQLRRLIKPGTSITYGIVQAGPHIEGGIPYIRTSDMSGEKLPLEGYLCTTHEIDRSYQRSKVKTGDVVVAIRATIGKALPVPPELDGANLTQGTAKISPGQRITTAFLLAALRSESARQQFGSLAKGTTFLEITLDMLRRFTIALPPLSEQNEIMLFIDLESKKLDTIHATYARQLALLAKYRAALIHECVTGQRRVGDDLTPESL